MCEIHLDILAMMWMFGGGFLGWLGMKSWINYKKRNKHTDTEPAQINDKETTTLE